MKPSLLLGRITVPAFRAFLRIFDYNIVKRLIVRFQLNVDNRRVNPSMISPLSGPATDTLLSVFGDKMVWSCKTHKCPNF